MKRRVSSRHNRSPRGSFNRSPSQKPKVEAQSTGISRSSAPAALPTPPTHAQSPLAALYSGMADIPEIDISPSAEDHPDQKSPTTHLPPPPLIARRRRLSSIGMLHRGPVEVPRHQSQSGDKSGMNTIPFSKSPELLSPEPSPTPKTVQEVEGQEEVDSGDVQLAVKLRKLEESQKKIEDMLSQLLSRLPNPDQAK